MKDLFQFCIKFWILPHFITYQQTSEYACSCVINHPTIINESYCGELADICSYIHNNTYVKLGAHLKSIENLLTMLNMYETISNRNSDSSFEKWVEKSIIIHSIDLGGYYTIIFEIETIEQKFHLVMFLLLQILQIKQIIDRMVF